MSDKTGATWNPVIGCRRVSEGCRNCYAEVQAKRIVMMQRSSGRTSPYEDVIKWDHVTNAYTDEYHAEPLPLWNGRALFMPSRLDQPLRWSKPRRVFVNSMSDLFHEDITFEQIAAVFGVMAASPQHTFQVLTKRPERAVEFFGWINTRAVSRCVEQARRHTVRLDGNPTVHWNWPLPNVWLGVSVEDQRTADERIPLLLKCPAAVRWVSAEPLLCLTRIAPWLVSKRLRRHGATTTWSINGDAYPASHATEKLDWVVVGGESGSGARPCDIAWIRSIVMQCRDAGVPAFVKQLGAKPTWSAAGLKLRECWTGACGPNGEHVEPVKHSKGGDPDEWPEGLRVRQWPEVRDDG